MSLPASLIAVESLAVGAAGAVACTRFDRVCRRAGPDATSLTPYRRESWTATCHAVAPDTASIASMWETLRSAFTARGQAVTLATHAGTRVLPASGAPAASEPRSIAGYPMVEMAEVPERSHGTWLTFTVKAESIIAEPDEEGLVEHDATTTESIDDVGRTTLTVRGTVRVVNGASAREWLDEEVIDPARADAEDNGRAFVVQYTQRSDIAAIEYEYTDAQRSDAGSGVSEARVEDTTSRSRQGRLERRVSGYAVGPSATTFAEDQAPAVSATVLLVRRSISLPSVPDGRVSFEYSLLSGVEDEAFPDIVIYRYQETISAPGGGPSAQVQTWFGANPDIHNGATAAYFYRQSSVIEFIGAWEDHGLTLRFDSALLAGPAAIEYSGGEAGLRRVTLSATFVSPTEITPLPEPVEIDGLA